MWGRFYWGRKGGEVGIVVVFAWVSSEERHLKPYIDLYYSLGWSSLVCHADFLTLSFPEKATSLADSILKELLKEIKTRTLPIVFAAFSGGPKGCMYKVVQLIEGKCGGQLSMDEYRLVGDCLCGQIYDSTPVDFKSDLGTRFVLHPSVLKMSSPPRIVSWMAKAFSSGLDALFINRFEAQRADYWQTLYSSANFGPVTIFASEDDELAPYSVVSNFAQRLQELGTDVNLVKWNSSPHVGHYKYHPDEYRAAVTELLRKAAIVFSNRRQHDGVSDMNNTSNPSPKSVYDHHRTAESSNVSFRRLAIDSTLATDPSNNYSLPSSMEYHESQAIEQAELFRTQNLPSMDARGVLGQILYDVCVAENIEGWDLNPAAPFNGRHVLRDKHGALIPVKGILRSRL